MRTLKILFYSVQFHGKPGTIQFADGIVQTYADMADPQFLANLKEDIGHYMKPRRPGNQLVMAALSLLETREEVGGAA